MFLSRRRVLALPALPDLLHEAGAAEALPSWQAFTFSLPPLSMGAEKTGLTGLAVDLLRLMVAPRSLALSLEPRTRAGRSFDGTPGSMLFPLARTAEREQLYRWIGPIAPRRTVIFCLSERSDIRFNGLNALGGLRLGVTASTATLHQLQAAGLREGRELELSVDYGATVRKLLAGRMDLMVMSDVSAYWQLKQLGEPRTRLKALADFDAQNDYCYAMRRDTDPALVAALQARLDRCHREGQVAQLKQQYGLPA